MNLLLIDKTFFTLITLLKIILLNILIIILYKKID